MPPWSRLREYAVLDRAIQAPLQRRKLARAEQLAQFHRQRVGGVGQLRLKSDQAFKHGGRDRLSGEIPYDTAQFVIRVEANAVIDGPETIARTHNDVAALSVRIVNQNVEQRDTLRLLEEASLQRQIMLLGIVIDKVL